MFNFCRDCARKEWNSASEVSDLRARQARRAMPLVSQLLEAWDQVPLDAQQQITDLAPGVVGNILGLDSVMEHP